MAIDLGDDPGGTPPTTGEKLQIRTAIGLGQTDAPTFLAQSLTGQSLTGTQATSLVDLATTWLSTTGTPTAIKLNVTDTANVPAASLLMDLQVGGVSAVKVSKVGLISVSDLLTSGGFAFRPSQSGSGGIGYLSGVAGVWAGNGAAIGFSTGAALGGAIQAALYADAPGILAQRNGVLAQAFRAYNTFTDPSNKEWGEFDWKTTTNTLHIGTNHIGTGQARPIDFVTGGVVRMSLPAAGGVLLPTGSAINFGTAAGLFNIYGNTTQTAINGPNAFGSVSLAINGTTKWVVDYTGLFCAGGTTSAFPAIKRNGTGIDIRLADDSGPAPLNCGNLVANGNIRSTDAALIGWLNTRSAMISPADGVIRLTNNAGTSYTRLELGEANFGISRGTGSPEGVVTALVGSLYLRTDGGLLTTLYVKESGTGNTGWVAK